MFGLSRDRRLERALIAEYEALLDSVLAGLVPGKADAAARLLGIYSEVRGYGPVKAAAADKARALSAKLLATYQAPRPTPAVAAE